MPQACNSTIALLERAARLFGDKPALSDTDSTLSFTELRHRARRLATALLPLTPADKTTPVLVMLPKGTDAIVAFMAALYTNNPYAPLDHKTPPARLEKIRETLGDHLLLTPDILASKPEQDDAAIDARLASATDADPAYIMFTSGSTGTPKGVAVPHRAVLDYARWVTDTFGFDTSTVIGNQAAFYFANSLFDIYGGLRSGALVDLIPEVLFTFPSKLPAYLAEQGITSIFWVPTVMKNIANSGALETTPLPKLTNIAFCGEILSNAYLNVWRSHLPQARYANLYGMTEASDACCAHFITRDYADNEPLPIGHPCQNMKAYILPPEEIPESLSSTQCPPGDPTTSLRTQLESLPKTATTQTSPPSLRGALLRGNPGCPTHPVECPTGEVGEICIAGAGLALGYWNRDDLTAAAFRRNPLEPRWAETLYYTGDLGFRGTDGLLYVRGRRDSQVKVKGNRIELGEVERAASTLSEAENVCVLFDPKAEAIVLFVQTTQPLRLRPLNQHLKTLIPDYMLPTRLELLPTFPLTASGKIDRMTLRKKYALT